MSVTPLEVGPEGCFSGVVAEMSDEQRIGTLEQKIDSGFAEMRAEFVAVRNQIVATERALRSESRSDFRTLVSIVIAMWVATALSVVALLAAHF
jgi:hypothetical protein